MNICFSSKKILKDKTPSQKILQERLFRQESMLLNLFWRRKILAAQIEDEADKLQPLALDMVSSSLSDAELASFLGYLLKDEIHLSVLEVPLELRRHKGQNALHVKEERAAKFLEIALPKQK